MTQLFIDNQEVALPEDFTFELIRENPYITKGGSFTLDISLNLDIPVNARLYRYLNRFNASSTFRNRDARLVVDGRIVLNGTEIILEVNELSASIQLCSGNSELNYLVGSDVKINTINLGKIPTFDSDSAKKSIDKSYPSTNYICLPVKANNGGDCVFINNFIGRQLQKDSEGYTLTSTHLAVAEEIRPMPYLNFIIEGCIRALGYTVRSNSITLSIYNQLYVIHANKPANLSDILPDMTVAEFLTEVEELLDVMFVINDKNVDIIFASEFYQSPAYFSPSMIEERFERKYLSADEQITSHMTSNISYDFESTEISKEYAIDNEVRKALSELHYSNLEQINAALLTENVNTLLKSIHIDDSTSFEFICQKKGEGERDIKLSPVNIFHSLTGYQDNDIEIKIVPVDIEALEVRSNKAGIEWLQKSMIQIPVVQQYIGTSEESITAEEAIQGKTKTSQSINKIFIAFNSSYMQLLPKGEELTSDTSLNWIKYPLSLTHYTASWITQKYWILSENHQTLAFKSEGYGLYERLYSKGIEIDTEHEMTIHAVLEGVIPKATDVFLIQGKKCICKDIQFKITPEGFDPEYQATLYEIK